MMAPPVLVAARRDPMPVALWWVDGPKVRALRVERQLSVARLARLAGFGHASLSRMEAATAGYQPWLLNVAALASALEVPPAELVGGDVDAFKTDLERVQPKPSP